MIGTMMALLATHHLMSAPADDAGDAGGERDLVKRSAQSRR